ncbi:MAG: hypothetical protein IJW95_05020 [Clostridia bacterium]|nr:hypothetical protein [Clostridia bacterium]
MPIPKRKCLFICSLIAFVCALGAATGLYFALTRGYDPAIRHFEANSPGALAAACLCIAGTVTGAVAAILLRREKKATVSIPGTLTIFAAILTAFMLMAVFMMAFRHLPGADILTQFRIALTALSALYFFFVTSEKASDTAIFPFVSLLPALFAVFSILCTYFDKSYGMNAPVKTYDLMMYIAMALFFTAEARCALRIPRPPLYALFGIACVTMCLSNGVAHSLVALNDPIGHGFSLVESATWTCIGLFALTRLLEYGRAAVPEKSSEPAQEGSDE